jgi:hypothetical protein
MGGPQGCSTRESDGMSRLPAVLSSADLPSVELDALRLDGEVFRLDGCAVALDEVTTPTLRAAAFARGLPPRLIAEQHSAAWIWGAQHEPPGRHEVCSDTDARTRPVFDIRYSVREVVIRADDIVDLSGTLVTSPLRTAVDLARFVTVWTGGEQAVVAALMRAGRFGATECASAMNRRRNLPGKRAALARLFGAAALNGIASDQPELTR